MSRPSGAVQPARELNVTSKERSRDSNVEDASVKLSDGLKTCRSVVANYKALLAPDPNSVETDRGDAEDAAPNSDS
jgi:hypothetical protein